MKDILFVCTGNTCRSPMAEGILKKLLKERGQQSYTVHSAGLFAKPGAPASTHAVSAAKEQGVDLSAHRATLLTKELVLKAQKILCMTKGHKDMILSVFPEAPCLTLKEAIGEHGEISDPFGGDLSVYRSCYHELSGAIQKWLEDEVL